MSDAPLADPGVRNYRTGLLRNARRWNQDHHWDWLDRCNLCGARLALASEFRRGLFVDPWHRQVPACPGGIELRPVEAFAPVEPFEDQSPRRMGVGGGLL